MGSCGGCPLIPTVQDRPAAEATRPYWVSTAEPPDLVWIFERPIELKCRERAEGSKRGGRSPGADSSSTEVRSAGDLD